MHSSRLKKFNSRRSFKIAISDREGLGLAIGFPFWSVSRASLSRADFTVPTHEMREVDVIAAPSRAIKVRKPALDRRVSLTNCYHATTRRLGNLAIVINVSPPNRFAFHGPSSESHSLSQFRSRNSATPINHQRDTTG